MVKRVFKKKRTAKSKFTLNNASKAANVASTAFTALKIASKVASMVNVEYKDFETNYLNQKIGDGSPNINVNGPGTVTAIPICTPLQGTGKAQRIGDSIKLQRLTIKGHVAWINQTAPPAGTLTANLRLIFFRGKADLGKTYPTTYLPGSGEVPILDQLGVLGSKDDSTKYNTKFLYDKVFKLDVAKTNLTNIKFTLPLNWHQNFKVGGIQPSDGGLYMMVISDTGLIPKMELRMYIGVSYTDD